MTFTLFEYYYLESNISGLIFKSEFYNLSLLLLSHFIKGLTDQYADGKAAKVWQLYIGDSEDRTSTYKKFLIDQLKKRNCKSILDAACGTGYVYF